MLHIASMMSSVAEVRLKVPVRNECDNTMVLPEKTLLTIDFPSDVTILFFNCPYLASKFPQHRTINTQHYAVWNMLSVKCRDVVIIFLAQAWSHCRMRQLLYQPHWLHHSRLVMKTPPDVVLLADTVGCNIFETEAAPTLQPNYYMWHSRVLMTSSTTGQFAGIHGIILSTLSKTISWIVATILFLFLIARFHVGEALWWRIFDITSCTRHNRHKSNLWDNTTTVPYRQIDPDVNPNLWHGVIAQEDLTIRHGPTITIENRPRGKCVVPT